MPEIEHPTDVTLFQWMWRTYVRQALVPLLLVEVVLLGAYLVTHEWSRQRHAAALRGVVVAEIQRMAARQATVIEQQLGQVAVLTETLRRQAQRAMAAAPPRPEDPGRYAVTSGNSLYARREDGGAGVFYSASTRRGRAQNERLARTAALDPVFADIKASSPLIVQVYFNSHDSLSRIWPWIDTSRQFEPAMDVRNFNFYYLADAGHNPRRAVVWTDAYADPAGQGWMVSCIAPVYLGDTLDGVVGADITLERIVSDVLATDLPWGGFGMLVANDGTLLALPSAAEPVFGLRELTDYHYDRIIKADTFKPDAYNIFQRDALRPLGTLLGTRGAGTGALRLAETQLVAWHTIPATGWRLVVLVPEAEVLAPARRLAADMATLGWVMLAGLVGFYAVFFSVLYRRARRVSRDIAEPLGQIRAMAQTLADGGFAAQPPRFGVREFRETVGELVRTGGRLGDANRARLAAEDRLRQRNRELSTILSLSPDGLVSFDADGRVVDSNPAFRAMTGLDADTLAGLDRDRFWQRFSSLCAAPVEPPAAGRSQRVALLRPRSRVLECTLARPGEPTEGAAEVAYFRDVTEMAELDRAKAQFVATAAHELRTPIAIMVGYAELLRRTPVQPADQQMMLGTIQRYGEHVAGLVNEMLTLARLDARGAHDLELANQAVAPLVRDLVGSFRMPDERRVAEFVDTGEPLFAACVDVDKFRQALGNVLSNAFKYSPEGGPVVVRLHSRTSDDRREVGVSVSDQGRGMDEDALAHVFDRFFRADHSGAIPGTGLGMSIVKEIMDLHGGRVAIDTAPGRGTTVTLWLPVVGLETAAGEEPVRAAGAG